MASSWFFSLRNYKDDARSHKHKIIPILLMITVAPFGSITGLSPFGIETVNIYISQGRYVILCHLSNAQCSTIHIRSHVVVGLFVGSIPHIYYVEIPITGAIFITSDTIPIHWDSLKDRMSLSKSQCTDVWLYILCLIGNYTKGVLSNYIPENV